MDPELRRRLEQSGYSHPGFAEKYDRNRPRPPAALLDLLPPLAGVDRPSLVVDLGSGTGLSTRFWAERAAEAVGVEPNDAVRRWAEQMTQASNVRYVGAPSDRTGLPEGCADIVTAAQSLHWMRPDRTLPEIGRILRPGGVFCAFEYFALQTPLWEPEAAWDVVLARKQDLRARHGLEHDLWPVSRERIEQSGVFRLVRELALHSLEYGDGDRLVGLALSEGSLVTLLEAGVTEEELGLDRLREAALGMPDSAPWWLGYRVWVGLK